MKPLFIIVGLCLSFLCLVSCAPPKGPKAIKVPKPSKKSKEPKVTVTTKQPEKEKCMKKDLYASCVIVPNTNQPNNIKGTIYFMQQVTDFCVYDYLSVQINVENLPKNDKSRRQAVHVHEYGDMSNGCNSMGGHYNPRNVTHGSPWHPDNDRHVGDFGNHYRNDRGYFGRIKTRHVDYLAKLYGEESIIGRGIVIHAGEDDLGMKMNDPESLKTGNAGPRLACCVIGHSKIIDQSNFSLYRK